MQSSLRNVVLGQRNEHSEKAVSFIVQGDTTFIVVLVDAAAQDLIEPASHVHRTQVA